VSLWAHKGFAEICKRINKEVRYSSGYMEHQIYIPPQDPHKNEKKILWSDINNWNRCIIIILTLMGLFNWLLIGVVASLLFYFWTGPEGFRIAEKYNKNPQWGYFYGFTFGFIGLGIYWLWARRNYEL
jgi:hypothetical protein